MQSHYITINKLLKVSAVYTLVLLICMLLYKIIVNTVAAAYNKVSPIVGGAEMVPNIKISIVLDGINVFVDISLTVD